MRAGGKLREETARNQAALVWAQGIELKQEVYCSSSSQPQPKPPVWLLLAQQGTIAWGGGFGLETEFRYKLPTVSIAVHLFARAGLQCLLEAPTHQSWI